MKKAIVLILVLAAAECWSMGYKPKHIAADSAWLVEIQQRMEKVDTVFAAAQWEYYSGGRYTGDLERASKEYEILVYTKYNVDRLKRIQDLFENPVLNRAARLAYIKYLTDWCYFGTDIGNIQMSLSENFINYRAEFEGEKRNDNYLRKIYRTDPDRKRREKAWLAEASIGKKIAPAAKILAEERNRMARYKDFEDFTEFELNAVGMTPDELLRLLDGLNLATRDKYLEIYLDKKDKLGVDKLQMWDILYRPDRMNFESHFGKDTLMYMLNTTFEKLGFNTENMHITYDLQPGDNKLQNGICMAIQIPDDIRILARIDDGFSAYKTLFHEYGHALHKAYVDQEHYIMRARTDGVICESMATICEEILCQPDWLVKYMNIPEEIIPQIVKWLNKSKIVNLRLMLAYAYYEMELYRTNAENPDKLFWDTMEKLLFCGRQDGSEAWASIYHFTEHPVYLQNYILADLVAAQTMNHMRKLDGSIIDNPKAAEYLVERYFRHGARYDWFDLVERATGEKLNAKYYLESILGGGIESEEIDLINGGE
jgi:peptidyl-dipeptidase A